MNIGFDAKRYFHNSTGLGNYSRTLVKGLLQFYPQHQYFLLNPKASKIFQKPMADQVHEVLPNSFLSKKFSSAWRSSWVKEDLIKLDIELYHGLSHEIPIGIQNIPVKSIVTIHDLIFERYPEQYKKLDIQIYRRKFKYACTHANRIIAISRQTKQDLIDLYKIEASKIDICYQSCHPAFALIAEEEQKTLLRNSLGLPEKFFLYVGSVIERKNLLNICKALHHLKSEVPLPLFVVGNGKRYKQKVQQFIQQNDLTEKLIFLSEVPAFASLQTPEVMSCIYQMATALIYPSVYEGFGIPVLEALNSSLPVITSNVSCLPETAGDAALYVDPLSSDEIAAAMKRIYLNEGLRTDLINKGKEQAKKFNLQTCSASVMEVYKKVLK